MNNGISLNKVLIAVLIVAVGAAAWISFARTASAPFCFDFVHDMQFGDRKVEHPVNEGLGLGNMIYYLPEVPALQTALGRQGFTIDPFEKTGGGVYAGAFFGPSTKGAVRDFQKKNGLEQTGEVNNATLDRLAALYSCPKTTATSSAATATTTNK